MTHTVINHYIFTIEILGELGCVILLKPNRSSSTMSFLGLYKVKCCDYCENIVKYFDSVRSTISYFHLVNDAYKGFKN